MPVTRMLKHQPKHQSMWILKWNGKSKVDFRVDDRVNVSNGADEPDDDVRDLRELGTQAPTCGSTIPGHWKEIGWVSGGTGNNAKSMTHQPQTSNIWTSAVLTLYYDGSFQQHRAFQQHQSHNSRTTAHRSSYCMDLLQSDTYGAVR